MKFTQIPLGTRFEFEGKIFSKTGPMTASAEDGSGPRVAAGGQADGDDIEASDDRAEPERPPRISHIGQDLAAPEHDAGDAGRGEPDQPD